MQRSDLTVYEQLFPAYAGVILSIVTSRISPSTFPRPRGGDPDIAKALQLDDPFSPPTRG